MTFNQKIYLAIEELNKISQERTDSGFITQGRVENHMRIKLSDFRRVLLAMKDKEECEHGWGIPSYQWSQDPNKCFNKYVCFKCQEVKVEYYKQPEQENDELYTEDYIRSVIGKVYSKRFPRLPSYPISDERLTAIHIIKEIESEIFKDRTKRSES